MYAVENSTALRPAGVFEACGRESARRMILARADAAVAGRLRVSG